MFDETFLETLATLPADPPEPKPLSTSKILFRAKGWAWLARYLKGESVTHIANSVGAKNNQVRKYMKEAAEALLGEAQAQMMTELVPLAREVMAATLRKELADIKAGNPPSTNLADRILKGMGVIDQTTPEHDGQSNEPDTLVAVLAHKSRKQLKRTVKSIQAKQAIEGEVVDQDNSTD
jgi:hypothetical protein